MLSAGLPYAWRISSAAAGVMPAGAVAAGAPAQGAQGAAAPQSTGAQIKNFVETKYGVKMYGYLKLDMSYDDSRVTQGNYALYAASEQMNGEELDHFFIVGELALTGAVRPVKGVLPVALRARAARGDRS